MFSFVSLVFINQLPLSPALCNLIIEFSTSQVIAYMFTRLRPLAFRGCVAGMKFSTELLKCCLTRLHDRYVLTLECASG